MTGLAARPRHSPGWTAFSPACTRPRVPPRWPPPSSRPPHPAAPAGSAGPPPGIRRPSYCTPTARWRFSSESPGGSYGPTGPAGGPTDHEATLRLADTLLLITDGLIEHGRTHIDEGTARLRSALGGLADLP